MTNFAIAILAAENCKGSGSQAARLKALSGFGPDEKKLLWYTFNPYVVFGVRKFHAPQVHASNDPSFDRFFKLLDMLAARELTGNAAKDAVKATLEQYTPTTAHVLTRVLHKDLDCGANVDSFEKIYPDLKIPGFPVMLASKIEEKAQITAEEIAEGKVALSEELLKSKYGLTFPLMAESKYDGNRAVALVENGVVEYYSRGGRPSKQAEGGHFDADMLALEQHFGCPIVVDGEVLASSFQETMNAKGSKNKDAKGALKFWAFDVMPLDVWKAQGKTKTQLERSTELDNAIKVLGLTKVVKSKTRTCNSIQELLDFYHEVLEEGTSPDGTLNGLGEGLIIKNPDGVYEWDRSEVVRDRKTKAIIKGTYWTKWKPVLDLDPQVVGYYMGQGAFEGTLGGFLLEGTDENGTFFTARCGSGLKKNADKNDDKTRDWFLGHLRPLCDSIGFFGGVEHFQVRDRSNLMTIKIEAQELSKAENANHHSARFPIYIKVRTDK